MIVKLFKKIFGTRNTRLLRRYYQTVKKINALEPELEALSDKALSAKTAEFKQRLAKNEATIDALLPEAFAVVREASRRTLGLRHFDVQMIGGIVLHEGKIAEMRTGEGKTLASTLPAYLNALAGEGVHVVTVNDYLAKRDAEWMKPIYEFLGMTVGINLSNMAPGEKQKAYEADVTYGTNNEFGFDYLRDNMVFSLDQQVQRSLYYAVVDEVDSILIDEARTPLIISGMAEDASDMYQKVNHLIPKLKLQETAEDEKEEEIPEDRRGDYVIDEKNRQVFLTEQGHQHVEELMIQENILQPGESLYDVANITIMHYLNAALRAHTLFQRDVHYVVKNNEVIIVDEHTGRLMPGRRWSDGLHQAVEVKEKVPVELENQTLASITFQNYFRLYKKLSGMTGTADTEAYEFQKIYGLEVVIIPTNRPMIRKDYSDIVFMTQKEKYQAILNEIRTAQSASRPVLVGTTSIESSEKLSAILTKARIPHEVLNAKQHEREAIIIAEAGKPGTVTIATNMAGRGTDIVLGGNLEAELHALGPAATDEEKEQVKKQWRDRHEEVIQAGGLHVLGTERHESRRIDNQLRGRAGRQGDPGSSQFYLSFEDNLLRIFASERMTQIMRRLGLKEGEMIQHPWITRAIENAQRRVEGLNFDVRKQLLEYDDVANDQRKIVYQQRHQILSADDVSETINNFFLEVIPSLVSQWIPAQSLEEEWDVLGLEHQIEQDFALKVPIRQWLEEEARLNEESLTQRLCDLVCHRYEEKRAQLGEENRRDIEKSVMLQVLDSHWKDHLAAMDHLRQHIHLRGYAQKNPTQEYKRESFELFTSMLETVKYEVVATLSRMEVAVEQGPHSVASLEPMKMSYHHTEFSPLSENQSEGSLQEEEAPSASASSSEAAPQSYTRQGPKVGRNDLCPCGSGKKYKQCHGKLV